MKPDYDAALRQNEIDYDLGRYLAQKSAIASGELKKYEKLSGKDILPTETHKEVGQQLFQYTPLASKL